MVNWPWMALLSQAAFGGSMAAPNNSFYVSNYPSTPNLAPGTTITGDGTSHVKGAYTELLAAAAVTADIHLLVLQIHSTFAIGVQSDLLIDIATGGAGSETVIVNNIPRGYRITLNGYGNDLLYLPVLIPSGTRVSARLQGLATSETAIIVAEGYGFDARPNWCFDGIDTYGANAAASQGTSITPGNSGAAGAWTSIGSATSRAYNAVSHLIGGPMTATMNTLAYQWQVGVSNTVLSGSRIHRTTGSVNEWMGADANSWCWGTIAQGTQLQMRGTCSGTAQAHDGIILAGYIN